MHSLSVSTTTAADDRVKSNTVDQEIEDGLLRLCYENSAEHYDARSTANKGSEDHSQAKASDHQLSCGEPLNDHSAKLEGKRVITEETTDVVEDSY